MVDAKSQKKGTSKYRQLLSFKVLLKTLPDLVIAGILINILALALPLSLLQMYDRIIPNKSFSTLSILIIGVLMAMFLEAVVQLIRGRMTGWTGSRFEHKISCQGMAHLMGVPLRKYESEEPDVYAEELGSARQVKDFYSGRALLVLLDLPFVFIYIAVIGLIGGWLAAVTVGMLVVFIAIATNFGNKLKTLIGNRVTQDDRRYNFLSETFRGIHSIKTMSMEHMMHRRYEQLQETNVEQGAKVADSSSTSSNMGSAFSQIMTVSIVVMGSVLSVDQSITPGALAGSIMLATRSLQPLRQSLGMWIRFQSFSVAKDRLIKLFELPNLNRETYTHTVDDIKGAVDIKNVTVNLPDKSEPLFEDMSLSINANECIVILGASGSGKTSIMNLINGTLIPDSGEVMIDGIAIDKIDTSNFHSKVAYLPQKGELVGGTIMENITMFDDSLTDQAFKVSEAIGLNHVVAATRLGYETPVGEGALGAVTGGVVQRIAIARAIVHDPKIILFDEANIAIDGAGDTLLAKYIESIKGKATIILVTHRPSYIRMADKVYIIKDRKLAVSSLEEHMANYKNKSGYSKTEKDRPDNYDWQIADTIQHFRKTSDFALCLPTLLTALEWKGARRNVAESLPHIDSPMDLSCLRSVMANLDYKSNSYHTQFNDLEPRLLPCLFVPDNGPAKVVISKSKETDFVVFNSDTV
ncbi:MAG TPA: ATP-binding cassette domain-containing protein, partial [Rhodospirillales bacterium]|nr:ATP-binding cassette domain-containing protein [Rhodospirillales bacterium]